MATLTISRAEQDGQSIAVSGWVDEGAAGIVTYDARIAIADLKALDTPLKRRTLIFAALAAVRTARLEQDAIDGQIGQLIGATGTV